jgi:hypothetical protein
MIIILFVFLGLYIVIYSLYPFLAISRPVYGDLLIVEGWIPDYALKEACWFFQQHKNYEYLVVAVHTKECVEKSTFDSCRDAAIMKMADYGINKNLLIPITDPKAVRGSRTYKSALATQKTLKEIFGYEKSVDVFTHASHARETFVMFKKAFGKNVRVGIIAAEPRTYNAKFWWMSKTGVHNVLKGSVGYVYAELYTLFI